MTKPALGRGLGALLSGVANAARPAPGLSSPLTTPAPIAEKGEAVRRVALERIRPSPFQPRKDFSAEALQELADSIREQGIIQPLIVREREGRFELIAGERRWRAAQIVGLKEAPVVVREADDPTMLELALIENLQRENLNPLEEALGYKQLIEAFHLRQEDAAVKVGKSRVAVANSLRLLQLPPEVQTCVRDGRLSVGHAKVILGLPGTGAQTQACHRVLKDGLTVRQTEELVTQWQTVAPAANTGQPAPVAPAPIRDTHVVDLENKLRERFGTKIALRYRKGRGAVEIKFFSDDELERILQIVGVKVD